MADKEQRQGYPLAPATGYARSDQEAASGNSKELRKKKRMKCLLYIILFAVFQTGIITLFALTIMKFRTPKFRVRSASFETLDAPSTSSTTFNVRMNTELSIRNTNFGHFRYRNTTIDFYYRGTKVGEAFVQRARVKALSTRKLNVSVDLTSTNVTSDSQLGSDISSGTLPLTAQARLRGRITIMLIMKKKKSGNLNCSMQLNIQTRQLQNLICK
ncbi:hypothetical protein LguiB_003730 [Lonicera macranthoides]